MPCELSRDFPAAPSSAIIVHIVVKSKATPSLPFWPAGKSLDLIPPTVISIHSRITATVLAAVQSHRVNPERLAAICITSE